MKIQTIKLVAAMKVCSLRLIKIQILFQATHDHVAVADAHHPQESDTFAC
jgi:hypothetical protein